MWEHWEQPRVSWCRIRECSSITGRGGDKTGGVGQMKFYPYQKKRGGGSHPEGGGAQQVVG